MGRRRSYWNGASQPSNQTEVPGRKGRSPRTSAEALRRFCQHTHRRLSVGNWRTDGDKYMTLYSTHIGERLHNTDAEGNVHTVIELNNGGWRTSITSQGVNAILSGTIPGGYWHVFSSQKHGWVIGNYCLGRHWVWENNIRYIEGPKAEESLMLFLIEHCEEVESFRERRRRQMKTYLETHVRSKYRVPQYEPNLVRPGSRYYYQ